LKACNIMSVAWNWKFYLRYCYKTINKKNLI
jgi:hypothetical protein